MTADAHALLTSLDGILADADRVESHLAGHVALFGFASHIHQTHKGAVDRLRTLRTDLAKALEPKGEDLGDVPDHWKTPPVITIKHDKPAMWASLPDAKSSPVAAEAVADSPAE